MVLVSFIGEVQPVAKDAPESSTALVAATSGPKALDMVPAPRERSAVEATAAQLKEVEEQFAAWNKSLASGDPKKTASLYAPGAVLLPTLSNVPRTTPEQIEDYFRHFHQKGPQGLLNEHSTRMINKDTAINSGIYTFTFKDGSRAKARYTFTYKKLGGRWMIAYHHSSLMPETFEDEIKHLFEKWADAVRSGDPAKVAELYAPDATLLPTVSNIPRTEREGFTDYFIHFLQKQPSGKVDVGYVTSLGDDAAAYTGIYTFTLKDGSQVPARFSFTYVRRGSKWLIADHHSSAMPEKVPEPPKVETSLQTTMVGNGPVPALQRATVHAEAAPVLQDAHGHMIPAEVQQAIQKQVPAPMPYVPVVAAAPAPQPQPTPAPAPQPTPVQQPAAAATPAAPQQSSLTAVIAQHYGLQPSDLNNTLMAASRLGAATMWLAAAAIITSRVMEGFSKK